jgi:hypothetical protein
LGLVAIGIFGGGNVAEEVVPVLFVKSVVVLVLVSVLVIGGSL